MADLYLDIQKNKLYNISDCWSRDMHYFDVLERGVRIVSLLHYVYDFSRKMFLMLCSIIWPNLIAWLPLLLEMLVNMCIAIICLSGCDVIDFEINLIFLIKLFSYMTKKSRQKFKCLENEKRWNKKHFSSFLKGFQMPEIVLDLRVCL